MPSSDRAADDIGAGLDSRWHAFHFDALILTPQGAIVLTCCARPGRSDRKRAHWPLPAGDLAALAAVPGETAAAHRIACRIRDPALLLPMGHEQLRSTVAWLADAAHAAWRSELALPRSGIGSTSSRTGAGTRRNAACRG